MSGKNTENIFFLQSVQAVTMDKTAEINAQEDITVYYAEMNAHVKIIKGTNIIFTN